MELAFSTERLQVFELLPVANNKQMSRLISVLPSMLCADVVAHLPASFSGVTNPEQAAQWLDDMCACSRVYVLKPTENGQPVGLLIVGNNQADDVHIGYLLAKAHWGKGLAFELLSAFISDYAPTQDWHTLVAGVERSNVSSIRLLEKLGFAQVTGASQEQLQYVLPLTPNTKAQ
ncbi:GNAT family N-acetyltransferase [Pseudoalteromonas sp. SSDWG2]|uniref:GNAT family N-acetyltransferase n=1 Tax=Pseudoalteromonas sp. SSDWG2 TaxID=3139391 RepID=UPI003BA9B299